MSHELDWSKIDRSGMKVAKTFGRFILGPLYMNLRHQGRLRIYGQAGLKTAMAQGPVIIVANHPSLIDTFLVAMVLFPQYLTSSRFFVWSMPDEKFFERFLNLRFRSIPRVLRCVSVDRDAGRNASARKKAAMEQVVDILRNDHSIVWHVGGGRDCTGKAWEEIERAGVPRRIRKNITSHAARVALQVENCRIVPVYIHMPWADGPLGFGQCLWRLFNPRLPPVTLSFGTPYTVTQPLDNLAEQERMKTAILNAGA